jgi:hypothetical protein
LVSGRRHLGRNLRLSRGGALGGGLTARTAPAGCTAHDEGELAATEALIATALRAVTSWEIDRSLDVPSGVVSEV